MKTNYSEKGISTILIVLIIVIVAVVGNVAIYLYIKNSSPKTTEMSEMINNIQTTTEQKEADETADLKTYTNKEYGFEIKYPPTWYELGSSSDFDTKEIINIAKIATYSKESTNSGEEYLFKGADLLINVDNRYSSLDEVRNGEIPSINEAKNRGGNNSFREGNIGEYDAFIHEFSLKGINSNSRTVATENTFFGLFYIEDKIKNKVYRLDIRYNENNQEHKDLLYQMLSTFKFIEKETTTTKTAEYQTLKAEKYGFSINVPKSYTQKIFQEDMPGELLHVIYQNLNKNRIIINIEDWSDADISALEGGFRQVIKNPEDYRSGKISNMVAIKGFISIDENKKDNYVIFTQTNPTPRNTYLKSVDIIPDYNKNLLIWIMYDYPKEEENTILQSVNSVKFSK